MKPTAFSLLRKIHPKSKISWEIDEGVSYSDPDSISGSGSKAATLKMFGEMKASTSVPLHFYKRLVIEHPHATHIIHEELIDFYIPK